MTHRILITVGDAPTYLSSDPSSVIEKLTSAVLEGFKAPPGPYRKNPPKEFLQTLRGKGDYFEYLETAGAPVTPMALVEMAAMKSGVRLELTVFDFGPGGHSGEPVATFDVSRSHSPAATMLEVIESIYENSTRKARWVASLPGALDGIINPLDDEDMPKVPAAKVLADLRLHQEMFGPPVGNPFRVVPDLMENEDASEVLASMKATAIERVEEILASIEWTPPAP